MDSASAARRRRTLSEGSLPAACGPPASVPWVWHARQGNAGAARTPSGSAKQRSKTGSSLPLEMATSARAALTARTTSASSARGRKARSAEAAPSGWTPRQHPRRRQPTNAGSRPLPTRADNANAVGDLGMIEVAGSLPQYRQGQRSQTEKLRHRPHALFAGAFDALVKERRAACA